MNDYLMDANDDLLIKGGDFVLGESNQQQMRKLLLAEKGEYKQAPIATVGLRSYLLDDSPEALLREIRLRFSDDGIKVQSITPDLKVIGDYGQ